jgi:hypothetical protein
VLASTAQHFEVGEDMAGLGVNAYVIERIGEPFTDDDGRCLVELTFVERKAQKE